ncbi:MAG: anti-sigma F factor [Candidatus Improbicoccus pseudotrichonymphae]|uniref:Anti-sigma F factor n=1 Tax=Candidatus Improbicoccus pseudotrichonymphae TaxID=3033792 RepID=A0AA48HUD2_9FIRM|nr:MAG: anti-sigma F factor [Candidatus Improbicoccus pseudotrichonymphae]
MKNGLLNEVNINFLSRSSNESFARGVISAFLVQLDPTIDELNDIKTAVSEAVTNCVIHAYKDKIGVIYIIMQIFSGGRIVIKIRDKGIGIENIKQAMEPLYTTGDDESAGLGFAVMKNFMDKVKIFSKPEKGTLVILEKVIIRRASRLVGC